jgi:preprotein translocase subunit Sec61beta
MLYGRKKSNNVSGPASGAGLIRFYQDQSNGIKISPITTLVLTGILVVIVILAQVGAFNWLLG